MSVGAAEDMINYAGWLRSERHWECGQQDRRRRCWELSLFEFERLSEKTAVSKSSVYDEVVLRYYLVRISAWVPLHVSRNGQLASATLL